MVRLEKDGDIGVIIVNYPPVNALGPGVAEGIIECINEANADPSIKAMVLMGDGRSFIAGADIRGFDANRKRMPVGERTYDVMDARRNRWSPRSMVTPSAAGWKTRWAAITASPCRRAKVGLPEVLIGILPGGGGTQRLPRLAGVQTALEMIVSGRHVPAPEAKTLGILDEVLPEGADLRAERRRLCAQDRRCIRPLPRVRDKAMQGRTRSVRGDAQVDRPPGPQPKSAI